MPIEYIFQTNACHFQNDDGSITIYNKGDIAPNHVANSVDHRHFLVPEEIVEPTSAVQDIFYNKLNKDQLIELCVDRGLAFDGTKAEMIALLEASDGAFN